MDARSGEVEDFSLEEVPDRSLQRELDATPVDNRARREMREWQIRRDKKRLAEIEARLAALRPEP
ncbi:MAG TPA: hypothetical protein VKS62_17860 [Methylomirabilota bacterium]|jgi:hypothetical protein|nr:hypothetical protein [Methylomirabilota bacterium]